ncbi:unnamed protein product [Bursaphelenchus xylophilus]|uniref:(pine wood nematode) hypothetical protein n=1 Tax=Bursaphelenchus xylophilus TaxID=6326 RepID=A0A1I7SCQ8_BURXY|nr:unnamed protein product [Bursaphelenchus xylophilus]CAG9093668.1 unnamed protein product [Bursaphelenchus xylophilus]
MITFNTVLTAICSLSKCFPQLDLPLRLEEGFLQTTDLNLATNQTLTVALDLASDNFWVFGANKVDDALLQGVPSGVLKTANDPLVVFNESSTRFIVKYRKPIYEDDFNITIQFARSVINLNTNALGIPQIGVALKNVTTYMSYLVGGSGVFGMQTSSYANGVTISNSPGNVMLLYTPTYGKTEGRVATGANAVDSRCSNSSLTFPMIRTRALYPGSEGNYFAFNSTLTNKKMLLSTMTSYVVVDPATFSVVEKVLLPVWDPRNLTDDKGIPLRKHKIIPCNLTKSAPVLTFGVEGKSLTLDGTDYVKRTTTGYCILKLRQMTANEDYWVLGYPFLQKYCVKVDFYKKTLSFSSSNQVAGETEDE